VVMTSEQAQLREQLIKRYGEQTFTRALEMSGIRCCLQALATDVLSPVERTVAYTQASMHLAKLQASFITPQECAALTECAKCLDSAVDMWALDDVEEREGLPPAP
jgi:hypothetical protein